MFAELHTAEPSPRLQTGGGCHYLYVLNRVESRTPILMAGCLPTQYDTWFTETLCGLCHSQLQDQGC